MMNERKKSVSYSKLWKLLIDKEIKARIKRVSQNFFRYIYQD